MQVGDEVGGRYRLVRLLGRGGMGVVYEAFDGVLDRSVALKILKPSEDDPDFTVRLAREASVLARLRSPHILTIFDHGTHGDQMYLVTEMVPDGDLQTWVRTRGPFAPLTAVQLCEQLCEALGDAHHLGVIHRDIKPANVLLWDRRDGLWAYLADFGIAREGSDALTRSGAVVGSISYMAPERHLGAVADERSDLYSVGCVLWSLLEGRAPYAGTDFQVMSAHLHEPVPALADTVVGREVITPVLDRLLAKKPEDRFASADEARLELAALVARLSTIEGADVASGSPRLVVVRDEVSAEAPESDDTGPHDPPTVVSRRAPVVPLPTPPPEQPAPPEQPERKSRRGVLAAVVAAILVLLVGVGVGIAVATGDDDSPSAGSDPTTSAPATGSTGAPPPAPTVEHSPAYRGVRFVVAPAEGATAEVRRGGEWTELAQPRFTEPTREGGEKVCLSFRAVADGVAGPPREECGRAAAAVVEAVRLKQACQTPEQGLPCAYYDIDVAGFRSGSRQPVRVVTPQGAVVCDDCWRPVPIGEDGRATVDGSLRTSQQTPMPGAFLLTVATDGNPQTFVIEVGDRSGRLVQPTR